MGRPRKKDNQVECLTYSIPEVAQVLGVGINLAERLIRNGEIKALKVGRRVIVPKVAVEEWLEKKMQNSGGLSNKKGE